MPQTTRTILSLLLAAGTLAAVSCSGTRSSSRAVGGLSLDGRFDEWPARAAATADADWIYFRVSVEDASAPLQAAPDQLALWLDADGDAGTGMAMGNPAPASGLGVDLVVEYSPTNPPDPSKAGRGVNVYALDAQGARTPLTHAQVGLASLPTFASDGYEVRLSRHADAAAAPALARALADGGRARAMFVLSNSSGRVVGWSDPETISKPRAGAAAPVSDDVVPPKPDGAIRILSYNVLKSKLAKEPNAFARLFQVIDADIILAQEWDADAATATAWFTAIVTGRHAWHARAAAGDVVIVSPYPIAPLGPDSMTRPSSSGSGETPIRFIGALVTTPHGPVAVASMHLKCCGTAGSVEDQTRRTEAGAINAALREALAGTNARIRILGGDLNLVGARAPLDDLIAGLDADGSNLTPAEPRVLGDRAHYTWSDPASEFPPGRLDFLIYSDASADAVQSYVLDTSRLSAKALARMGLDAGDTASSDHLPVVLDIRPR